MGSTSILRALSKPAQMRQDPDLLPLRLLAGTHPAIRPELASRRAACPIQMSLYMLLIYDIYYYGDKTCIDFYGLPAWGGC